jgi:cysteine desulfurase
MNMSGDRRMYFDSAATTPLDPRVRAAMEPFLGGEFGNPSSLHAEGRTARAAVEGARRQVAELVGANASGVVFTGSGTEADNLALVGVARGFAGQPVHIVTSGIEHPAVRETCEWLVKHEGVDVTCVSVTPEGIVDPDALAVVMRPETRLVSIMAANNVIGTLQPVRELARVAHAHGALFHTDAVQAASCVALDMQRDGIDLLSLSGHKLYGPKGVGALVRGENVSLTAVIQGGGQERGLRSGTENVVAIVGFGEAARLCSATQGEEAARLVQLRERLIDGVLHRVANAYLIGDRYRRLPGHVCLGFAGQEGESIKLMLALDEVGVAVSTGSACSAHKASEPSYVLTALGFDVLRARGALRITLGRFNTEEEVDRFLDLLPSVVRELRPITRAGATAGVRA